MADVGEYLVRRCDLCRLLSFGPTQSAAVGKPPPGSDIKNLAYSGFPRFDSTRRAAASFTSAQACCAPFGIFRIVFPELPVNLLLAALRSSEPKKAFMWASVMVSVRSTFLRAYVLLLKCGCHFRCLFVAAAPTELDFSIFRPGSKGGVWQPQRVLAGVVNQWWRTSVLGERGLGRRHAPEHAALARDGMCVFTFFGSPFNMPSSSHARCPRRARPPSTHLHGLSGPTLSRGPAPNSAPRWVRARLELASEGT